MESLLLSRFFSIRIIVDNNNHDGTPCVNIQVNSKDINVIKLSVPLTKWSDNNWSLQSDLADFNLCLASCTCITDVIMFIQLYVY